jgi:hypothetical protein
MNPRPTLTSATAVCTLALAGSDGSSNSSNPALAPTSQVRKDTVSGFRSVSVNGVGRHTGDASFTLDAERTEAATWTKEDILVINDAAAHLLREDEAEAA